MSVFVDEVITCPHCEHSQVMKIANSVNAVRSPKLREEILEGSFQRPACAACGERFEISDPFLYVDLKRQQWIGVFPEELEDAWRSLEQEPLEAFKLSAGAQAPPMVQEMAAGAKVRAVFGLNALREKLLCDEAGLDDLTLELLKVRLGLAPTGELLGTQNHIRLIDYTDQGDLLFLVGGVYAEAEPSVHLIARSAYETIEGAPELWAELGEVLSQGPFVDVGRLMVAGDAPVL